MSKAAEIQAERVNHQERVSWLSGAAPRWACGELVDAHSRNVLLLQSRSALSAAGAA